MLFPQYNSNNNKNNYIIIYLNKSYFNKNYKNTVTSRYWMLFIVFIIIIIKHQLVKIDTLISNEGGFILQNLTFIHIIFLKYIYTRFSPSGKRLVIKLVQ
jgi:hypothetical protein